MVRIDELSLSGAFVERLFGAASEELQTSVSLASEFFRKPPH